MQPCPKKTMKIVLTRESEDNMRLARFFAKKGFFVIDYPCITVQPVRVSDERMREILVPGRYRAFLFTSRRGVGFFLEMAGRRFSAAGATVAAVGEATAEKCREAGILVDVVARDYTGKSLGADLLSRLHPGDRVLCVRGNLTTGDLAGVLREGGIVVEELVVYKNDAPLLLPLDPEDCYIVVCASPSAASRFVAVNPLLVRSAFVAIGPVTAARLKELGASDVSLAERPEDESLAKAILKKLEEGQTIRG